MLNRFFVINIMENDWIDKMGLLIRMPQEHKNEPPFLFHDKIAGFNFYNTLVKFKTENKHVFENNWELWDRSIIPKLEELQDNNYSIIVSSNQDDIIKGKSSKEILKSIFEDFCSTLFERKISIIGFFSTRKNFCHKPYTGMWKILDLLYEKKGFDPPKRKNSVYIGNLAGRKFTHKRPCRTSDKSCIDRAFAYNLSVKFYTPEYYFRKEKRFREWKYKDSLITKEERLKIQEESNSLKDLNPLRHGTRHFLKLMFRNIKQYLVIIIGPPTSSKTTLCRNIMDQMSHYVKNKKLKPWVSINLDQFGTHKYSMKKYLHKISEEISCEHSVIIDGNNSTVECRSKYIDIVREFSDIGILLIEIILPVKIAKQLNCMRMEISNDFNLTKTSDRSYSRYYKELQSPMYEEFADISRSRIKIIKYPFLLFNIKEWWYIYDN